MLGIENKQTLPNHLVEISDNLTIVHFDEFPILYYGTNVFNNKILGSHLEEDDDQQRIYTLQSILTNKQFSEFLGGKKSYLTILQESSLISIVEKSFDNKTVQSFGISFEDIPKEYLPLENSFCPIQNTKRSLVFGVALKGLLADLNKAATGTVSQIQDNFGEFIKGRIDAIKSLQLTSQALLTPYSAGSFKINFEVQVSKKSPQFSLFEENAPVEKFISEYILYLTAGFNDDITTFLDAEAEPSKQFLALLESFNNLFENSHHHVPDDSKTILKDDIIKALPYFEKITDQIGKSFNGLEFVNVISNNENVLGYIDSDFATSFYSNIEQIESAKNEVITDDDFKDYNIYIYHLNTDTRSGNAWIKDLENPDLLSRPKIKIDGDTGLEETKYTNSLHSSEWITVKAKAKKVNNKYVYLTIQYE